MCSLHVWLYKRPAAQTSFVFNRRKSYMFDFIFGHFSIFSMLGNTLGKLLTLAKSCP